MSEYFRVLQRLETEHADGSVRAAPLRLADKRDAALDGARAVERPSETASYRSAAGYATLFDNLRVLGHGEPIHSLVIAGASSAESAARVATGLGDHARRTGLRVCRAEIVEVNGRCELRPGRNDSEGTEPGAPRIVLDLREGSAPSDVFAAWLDGTRRKADVVLIEGRPLSESVESAVLARCCDGLVLVAAPEATRRDGLQLAAERARFVGCRTLGLVIESARNPMPAWMQRLLPGRGALTLQGVVAKT